MSSIRMKKNENLDFLFGEIIVLKNGKKQEFFKIVGSHENDFVLEKINPIIIDNAESLRPFNKKVA